MFLTGLFSDETLIEAGKGAIIEGVFVIQDKGIFFEVGVNANFTVFSTLYIPVPFATIPAISLTSNCLFFLFLSILEIPLVPKVWQKLN